MKKIEKYCWFECTNVCDKPCYFCIPEYEEHGAQVPKICPVEFGDVVISAISEPPKLIATTKERLAEKLMDMMLDAADNNNCKVCGSSLHNVLDIWRGIRSES